MSDKPEGKRKRGEGYLKPNPSTSPASALELGLLVLLLPTNRSWTVDLSLPLKDCRLPGKVPSTNCRHLEVMGYTAKHSSCSELGDDGMLKHGGPTISKIPQL